MVETPATILLVEDDPAHVELARRAFESVSSQFNVCVAESLSEAKAYLNTHAPPALIISDWRLTDGDGMELISLTLGGMGVNTPIPPRIPVVLMTNQGNERVAVEAIKAGALDYVVKSETALFDMPHTAARALLAWDNILKRARAEEELRRKVEELTVLSAIATIAAESPDEDTLIGRATAVIRDLLFPENFGVLLLDEQESVLRHTPSFHTQSPCAARTSIPLGQGITGKVAATGIARRVDDVATDSDYIALDVDMRSEICVPLKVNQRVVGVIDAESSKRAAFGANDERLLITVANQLATAIERMRAARAVRESEERFRRLSEASFEGLVIHKNGIIVDANSAMCQTSGYTLDELIGMNGLTLVTREHWDRIRENMRADSPPPIEVTGVHKDGTTVPLEMQARSMTYGSRTLRVVAVRNISERKRLEEQLRQMQKLQVVGQMAGGIAHDFNNLLTVVIGYSDLLLSLLPEGPDSLHAEVQQIKDAGKRAAALTQQLLAFSRRQLLDLQVLDLNAVVTNLAKLLKRLIGEDIVLHMNLHPQLGAVRADPGQLDQVIMNLATNARDAMPRGGSLFLETNNAHLDESYARNHYDVQPGPYVMLAISDTGTGMTKETLSHIFEPFYTTKEKGKGVGLGLATVHGIIKQCGGHILVYSEVGRGTTFKIYLPKVMDVAETDASDQLQLSPAHRATETILLVEDEPAVRRLAHEVLKMQGYTVLEGTSEEAIKLGEEYAHEIHLLVTDVVMPAINGRELAERLKQSRAALKVLYMSGYTDNILTHHGILKPESEFLPKPFTPTMLTEKVRAVLDSP